MCRDKQGARSHYYRTISAVPQLDAINRITVILRPIKEKKILVNEGRTAVSYKQVK